MTKRKKYILITTAAVVGAAALLAGDFISKYYKTRIRQIDLDETAYIYITPEDSASSIAARLEEIIAPATAEGFTILSRHNKFDDRKRSGKFAIKNGDTMKDIYYRIVSNTQTPVRLTPQHPSRLSANR